MLIKDIDLNVIADILKELPEGLSVTSISLTNGYEVNLMASVEQIHDYSGEEALKEILRYIRQNKKAVCTEKIEQNKNYLLIDD